MLNFAPTSEPLYAAALEHHLAGRAAQAEQLYRQVLAQHPQHADAWHMLGALAFQHRKLEAAIACMTRAVELSPQTAVYRSNLGEVCSQAGKLAEAEAHLQAAIALDPRFANAFTNLAALLIRRERYAEALQTTQHVLTFAPDNATAERFAGDALAHLDRHEEALRAYERALVIDPHQTDARFNLGALHMNQGRYEEAAAALRQVIAARPDDWEARLQLVEALEHLNRPEQVQAALTDLLRHNPTLAQGHAKLANLLRQNHRLDEALAHYDQAVALNSDNWTAHANRAFTLRDLARLDEAVALLQQQVAAHPEHASLHSGLIFTLQLLPHLPPEELARQQHLWNRRHGDPVAAQRGGYANVRDPARRLRIGYVSHDLRAHPVGRFLLPLIRQHNRQAVEVFCFHTGRATDAVTAEFRAATDHFISLAALNDDQSAALIRTHAIDILIDLSNHTIGNRLPLFARKPAPVQISYLAFCAGTGLETIDWRLTDPHIDPRPLSPTHAAHETPTFEQPLHLAHTYWCYAPHPAAGEVTALPALADGTVTFGGFNHFCKCNDQVLALWADLLSAIPAARIVLHVPTGSREAHVRRLFEARAIAPQRLHLIGRVNEDAYFRNYSLIDIALDPFPWAGGTTTCDALYMGVPVITLAPPADALGATLQRGGVSILTNLGHPAWIAHSNEEYIAIARTLAADLPALARLRATLRPQMQASALMDAPRFARDVEAAYRRAWQAYCSRF